jgi:hypothetical protein
MSHSGSVCQLPGGHYLISQVVNKVNNKAAEFFGVTQSRYKNTRI